MPEPFRTYDLARVFLIVGGIRITGGDGDSFLEIAWESEVLAHEAGADGSVVGSRTNDKRAVATITLMETNTACRLLNELFLLQQAESAITPIGFDLTDAINGDQVADPYAVFLNRPSVTKSKQKSAREFRILLPRPTEKLGTLLA